MRLARFFDELEALAPTQLATIFPLVVLSFAAKLGGKVPPALTRDLDGLVESLGWTDADDDAARATKVERYLERGGVTPEVWRRLLTALHADPEALAAVAQKLSGGARVLGALERKAPPPPGTVGAGPFARFATQKLK